LTRKIGKNPGIQRQSFGKAEVLSALSRDSVLSQVSAKYSMPRFRAQARVQNAMTALFDQKGSDVTVENVLSNGDFVVSLRNGIPQLMDFIVGNQEKNPNEHLAEPCASAFRPDEVQQKKPNGAKFSSFAARCFPTPSNVLMRRL
jgi:hypothetical protein